MHLRFRPFAILALGLLLAATAWGASSSLALPGPAAAALPNPLLFVTQVPNPATFATIGATFGDQSAGIHQAPRGGDLWIRYPDGTLKNLTSAAGYGSRAGGFQDASAIAVRDPSVSWDGARAIFSMVVGAPTKQYQVESYRWQLYEISGLGQSQTPVIARVPNQPSGYNNISPIYGTNGRIIFISDRPRGGEAHLYPQLDEYELTPVNTGLWSLDPAGGDLFLMDHSPSGDFSPTIDSYGRVIFTRWDHLQRDQEADADHAAVAQGGAPAYGTFNYASEAADAPFQLNDRAEVFPEPRGSRGDLLAGTNIVGHTFNFFGPWQVNEDGSEAETLNHIGRQEFGVYAERSFNDDPNLTYLPGGQRANQYQIGGDGGLFQIKESAVEPGLYYATNAPEFGTHGSGQIITLTGAPTLNADQMVVTPITHPATESASDTPSADHSGFYRDPLPLSDGGVVVAHAPTTRQDENEGSTAAPRSRYDYRLRLLAPAGNGYQGGGAVLTAGISETVSYWSPDVLVSYSGPLWELQPVELRPRAIPQGAPATLHAPELAAFAQAGVDPAAFKAYLAQNNLALAVSRDVTVRDNADRQQPFNLRVPGGAQTVGAGGKIYDVTAMQFFQADLLRGKGLYAAGDSPAPGRRVLAQPLHDPAALGANARQAGPLAGSVTIGEDGSMAAVVPARRALTWQLTDGAGVPVVRERVWATFQPGEVRVCASCHGLNNASQAGGAEPTNTPEALVELLLNWKEWPQGGAPARVYLPLLRR
jgi:hypothetical protein